MTPSDTPRQELDVVVGVDGSGPSRQALAWAAAEAKARGARLVPTLCWTAVDLPVEDGFRLGFTSDDAAGVLARIVDEVLGPDPGVDVVRDVITEVPAKGLLDRSHDAGLLVVGDRGLGGFAGLRLGSVSQRVAAHATVPTVVTRGDALVDRRKVVVGFDGSEISEAALRWAADHAARRGARLEVVRAWVSPMSDLPTGVTFDLGVALDIEEAHRRSFTDDIARVLGEVPSDTEIVLTEGPADVELVDRSRDADLLVVGPRGRGPIASRLLGSVTYKLLHNAECSVAVVPLPRPV